LFSLFNFQYKLNLNEDKERQSNRVIVRTYGTCKHC